MINNNRAKVYIEDDILTVIGKDEIVDIKAVKEVVDYRLLVSEGGDYPLLSDMRAAKKATKEAREYLSSDKGREGVLAAAVLVNSTVGSFMVNFFLKINKPKVPTRLFTEEDAAKKWLKQFV